MIPTLLHSEDGTLFIQIEKDGVTVIRPTPANLKSYSPEDSRVFFETVVPSMIAELVALRTEKRRKARKKGANEKHRGHTKRRNPGSDA
jgi:hypothetical protein